MNGDGENNNNLSSEWNGMTFDVRACIHESTTDRMRE